MNTSNPSFGLLIYAEMSLGSRKLAVPILLGQLAIITFGVMDTAMTARFSTDDFAALGMAASIFISIYVGLTGILSALNPIGGQLFRETKKIC
jgi:MATE family multidrug resistance protein